MRRLSAIALCMLLCSAGRTFAQEAPEAPLDRVRLMIGVAPNAWLDSFAAEFERTSTSDGAPIKADLTVSRSPTFLGGARIRFWRTNYVGVTAFYRSGAATGTVRAMVPHPLYINHLREVAGPVSLDRSGRGLHFELVHTFDISRTLDLSAFGGPTLDWIDTDVLSDIAFIDAYPYDTVTFTSAVVSNLKGFGAGYNVGGDMTWHFSRVAGLAAQGRYLNASVDFRNPDGSMRTVKASRIQAGVGLRFFLGGR